MKFILALAATASLLLSSLASQASTTAEVTVKCPIGEESFTTIQAISGTQYGTNLDQKPFGAIIAPWPIAKCPDNGFVIYKKDFSEDELTRLKMYVLSQEYQAWQKVESNYYLAAILMSHMNESLDSIAYVFLKSTWEVESDSRYQRYAEQTLMAF